MPMPGLKDEMLNLQWVEVESSNLSAIAYTPTFHRMWVWFKGGGKRGSTIYVYYDVPPEVYQGLVNASSHGEYLDKQVKKRGYGYQRIS